MRIVTDFYTNRESARRERFEPVAYNSATNVQKAIEGSAPVVTTARLPASAATINGLLTDVEVGIDTGPSAVLYSMPSLTSWATQNPGGLELTIFDLTGHAAAHNITFSTGDGFVQGSPTISANFGLCKFRPVLGSVMKWYIRGIN